MFLSETTTTHQAQLAAYCRTGVLADIPGIRKENISHYRRLVYNIVNDMLENAYPLTKKIFSAKEWKMVVNEFFSSHPCQTPQVWYMPKEFYEYLTATDHILFKKYPFLKDLLWFEWIELELFMMEDKPVPYTVNGDILFSRLILNPENKLLAFQYPVHYKNARYISLTDRANYFVAAHRSTEGVVVFTDLSPGLARLIEYLSEEPLTVKELITKFENEYGKVLGEGEQKSILEFIETSYNQQLIIGFKN
jgi:uncharacterized protein